MVVMVAVDNYNMVVVADCNFIFDIDYKKVMDKLVDLVVVEQYSKDLDKVLYCLDSMVVDNN